MLINTSGGEVMHANNWLLKLTDARSALRQRKPDQAASLIAPVLEGSLRQLVYGNLTHFASDLRNWVLQQEREMSTSPRGKPSLNFLINLVRNPRILSALEQVTGRNTQVLKTLDLRACQFIRNNVSHNDPVSADEARLLLSTIEHLLAYLGLDVDTNRYSDPQLAPLPFSDRYQCVKLLLRNLWKFPESGGAQSSWAVKESDTLRGMIERATQRPGLGIALFTTELASEVFGAKAQPKIRASVDWGVSRAAVSPPYLLAEDSLDSITGRIIKKSDFRHTLALAILMIRSGSHVEHQKHYLLMALENVCSDGGWPAVIGSKDSDLPATAYAVEYLAASARSDSTTQYDLADTLKSGQEWLILAASADGGWSTGIFADTSWDHIWSTAYLLPRLLSMQIPLFPEWTHTMIEAAEAILRGTNTVSYTDARLQFRVEARIAAALTRVIQERLLPVIRQDAAESWLHQWEIRFLETLREMPAKDCDLATTTFACRALLKDMDWRRIGNEVLVELT
jgi:hypothetical protein